MTCGSRAYYISAGQKIGVSIQKLIYQSVRYLSKICVRNVCPLGQTKGDTPTTRLSEPHSALYIWTKFPGLIKIQALVDIFVALLNIINLLYRNIIIASNHSYIKTSTTRSNKLLPNAFLRKWNYCYVT